MDTLGKVYKDDDGEFVIQFYDSFINDESCMTLSEAEAGLLAFRLSKLLLKEDGE